MADSKVVWGDPSPAGLFAIGAGTTAVWAVLTGRVGLQDLPMLTVWLLAVGFVQTLVGLIHLRNGDAVGGSLNLSFGILFFGAPGLTNVVLLWGGRPLEEVGIAQPPDFAINGWVFLVLGAVLASFLPILARQSWLSTLAVTVFAISIWMLALYYLQPAAVQATPGWMLAALIAGWMIGVAGLTMVYLGMALVLAYGLGRAVLPVGGPLVGGPLPGPAPHGA